MKTRYPIIGIIAILIIGTIARNTMGVETYKAIGQPIAAILFIACLGLVAYLIIRNIFRAITGTPAGGYRGEARKACERVTPKKVKRNQENLPWEG